MRSAFRQLNLALLTINDRIDQLQGLRGTPTFNAAPDFRGNPVRNVGDPDHPAAVVTKSYLHANALTAASDTFKATRPIDMNGKEVVNMGAGLKNSQSATVGQLQTQAASTLDTINQLLQQFVKKPVVPSVYTVANAVPDRSYDAAATTLNELAQVIAALIADLRAVGILA